MFGVVITMKLNNKGWGLGTFLIFLLVFFLFLLLITVLVNQFNSRFIVEQTISCYQKLM